MNTNRRNFFKSTILGLSALPVIGKFLGTEALAADDKSKGDHDSKVKLQGYDKTGKVPTKASSKKKYDGHVKKLEKAYKAKKKELGKNVPQCVNCKHYKPNKKMEGWGKCAMVGATGKPGKWVRKNGWCKVWAVNKKSIA